MRFAAKLPRDCSEWTPLSAISNVDRVSLFVSVEGTRVSAGDDEWRFVKRSKQPVLVCNSSERASMTPADIEINHCIVPLRFNVDLRLRLLRMSFSVLLPCAGVK